MTLQQARLKLRPNLRVFGHTAQENKHPISSPPSFIASLVHACMLLLPSAEWIMHIPLCCDVCFVLVASSKADATNVQLTLLTYRKKGRFRIAFLPWQETANCLLGTVCCLAFQRLFRGSDSCGRTSGNHQTPEILRALAQNRSIACAVLTKDVYARPNPGTSVSFLDAGVCF